MKRTLAIDTKDELLDLVDENDRVIGTVWKSKAHQNPKLFHREVAIAVFTKAGKVLLQQRSMNKVNDPGAWKVSAAGHAGAGENPKQAIAREVKEELGLEVKPIYFNKDFTTYKNKESRFTWMYYSVLDKETSLRFDKEEVMDAKWVDINALEEFAKNNDYSLNSTSHKMIMELKDFLKF